MTAASRAVLARHITEDQLLTNIVQLAALLNWKVHHCRPARTADGWRTPVQGSPGFPDLVLAHPSGRLIFAETKAQAGRWRPEQVVWRGVLDLVAAACPGVEVREWRPSDWLSGDIQAVLTTRPARVTR